MLVVVVVVVVVVVEVVVEVVVVVIFMCSIRHYKCLTIFALYTIFFTELL